MAPVQILGKHYGIDGRAVNFFGARGTKSDHGRWSINGFNSDVWVEVAPVSVMDRVRDCIARVAAGDGDKIAQLQLGARQAVVFYLEGELTLKHLEYIVEGPDFVDIPGVNVDGRTLTVRVQAKPEYDVAVADSEGNVL